MPTVESIPERDQRVVQSLTADIEDMLASSASKRVLIGIAGAPGSGKSTLAALLQETLGMHRAVVLPMDGFHLARAVIDNTPLKDRRGAIDTFDGWGYLALLERVASHPDHTVYAPIYRRGLEEPIAGSIPVRPDVPIVLTEGNYLLSDSPPWRQVRDLLTETWFVNSDEARRTERLILRHIDYGMDSSTARAWTTEVDARNAQRASATSVHADRVISWG